MKQETTMSQALSGAQVTAGEALASDASTSSRNILEAMRAKVLAYQPEAKMTNLDYVREMFDLLEAKLSAGAKYAELAGLMKNPKFDVKEGTLKTMMSKIRAEKKVLRVKCPCCQSEVPESSIGEQIRDDIAVQAGDVIASAV